VTTAGLLLHLYLHLSDSWHCLMCARQLSPCTYCNFAEACRLHTYKVEFEAGADRCRPINARQVCSDTKSLGRASTLSKQQMLTAWNLSRSGSSGSRCVRLCTTALRTIASASVAICCRIDRMRDGRISEATYGASAPQASATRALRSACL